MQEFVQKLAKDRQNHIDEHTNITLGKIREKKRKSYVPRLREKDELKGEVKYTKSWKGSGTANGYFMEPPIMRPKMLDPWTASRVQ